VLQKTTVRCDLFLSCSRTMLVNVEVDCKPCALQADSGEKIELPLLHHLQLAFFEQSLALPWLLRLRDSI